MIEAQSVREVEDAVLSYEYLMLFFSRQHSAEATQLARRIRRLGKRYPNMATYHIDLDAHPTASSRYLIYHVPTVLLYAHGKPRIKRIGVVDINELNEQIVQIQGRNTE
jgi:putative NIF3 family GTP cyclohydrolase 1 type 2